MNFFDDIDNSKLQPSMFMHLFISIIVFGGGVRKRTGLANFALLSIDDKRYRRRVMRCGLSGYFCCLVYELIYGFFLGSKTIDLKWIRVQKDIRYIFRH